MAEVDYALGAGPARHETNPEHSGITTLINIGGALMSIGLLVGVGVWGYKLLSRDVTGIPVVRAVEGPMRIQPEDPGGQQADNQGLAVNDVAARGSATAPADRLVLAPQPVHLMDEDQPAGSDPVPASDRARDRARNGAGETSEMPGLRDDRVDALVQQLTQGVAPIDTGPADPDSGDVTQVVAVVEEPLMQDDQAEPATDPAQAGAPPEALTPDLLKELGGVVSSPRPRARPAADPQTASAAAMTEIDPASLPAGTRLAQLGAYESAEIARSEWQRISARFAQYFEDKQPVIQKASSGGRTFYRLRAMGFEDLSDARRFCAVLVAGSADCIPVTTR